MQQVEVLEELSKADASVGWCSFIWCDSGIYSGYLDDAVAREMYPRLDMATSGWVYPVVPARREGALWARPDTFLRKMSGVSLGVAADALRVAREAMETKADRLLGVPYREMPRVQSAIAEAHATLASARSYVFSSLETQWAKLETGEPLTIEERADVWMSRTNAFQAGRTVVSQLYDLVGGSAIYTKNSPFDRHLRDMQTACQHVVAQTKTWEGVGSLLLGNPGGHPMI